MKVSRVGILGTVPNPQTAYLLSAFTNRLREHGYVVGQNVLIEHRYSEGKTERFADLVAELVRLNVEQPTKFELAISVKTAKPLGVTIPQAVLLRADHIVEWRRAVRYSAQSI